MSITKCPECGNQISTSAKTCIHCGFSFKICRECGNIIAADSDVCPECGYREHVESKKTKDASTIYDEYCLERKTYKRIITYLEIALLLGSIILFVAAIVKVLVWANSIDFLLTFTSNDSGVRTLLIFSGILFSFYCIVDTYLVLNNDYANWLKMKSLNAGEIIKEAFKVDFSKLSLDDIGNYSSAILEAINAEIQENDPITRFKKKNAKLLSLGAGIAFAVLFTVFIILNAQNYMKYVFLMGQSSFSFEVLSYWWLLILSIVCFLVKEIVEHKMKKKEEIFQEEWVKNSLPDKVEIYNKYIKNYVDLINDYLDETDKTS